MIEKYPSIGDSCRWLFKTKALVKSNKVDKLWMVETSGNALSFLSCSFHFSMRTAAILFKAFDTTIQDIGWLCIVYNVLSIFPYVTDLKQILRWMLGGICTCCHEIIIVCGGFDKRVIMYGFSNLVQLPLYNCIHTGVILQFNCTKGRSPGLTDKGNQGRHIRLNRLSWNAIITVIQAKVSWL